MNASEKLDSRAAIKLGPASMYFLLPEREAPRARAPAPAPAPAVAPVSPAVRFVVCCCFGSVPVEFVDRFVDLTDVID